MQNSKLRHALRFVATWLILIGVFYGLYWTATTYSPFRRCRHGSSGEINPLILTQIDRSLLNDSQRELLRLLESDQLVGESRAKVRPLFGEPNNVIWDNGHERFSIPLPGIKDRNNSVLTPMLLISVDSECDHIVACSLANTDPGWGF